MGILRNRTLISLMSWIEGVLYDKANRVVALTRGIRDNISGRGWSEKKLAVITCGVDTHMLYPDTEAGIDVRRNFGWEGRNVILYFGAMGEANNLDVVIDAAMK
ncbi:MAG: glycosyltransferase WbuB, partial [Pseudomonas sp. PGPPP3]